MIPADYDPMADLPDWARSVPKMDHRGGRPQSRYHPQIGRVICQRVAWGMTLRQIAADPDMPSYATIFHWLKLYGDFADLYAKVRREVAVARLEDREFLDAERAAQARAAREARLFGERPVPRDWGAGRRSGYSLAVARRFCEAIAEGGSLKTITRREGMPSVKQIYSWLRRHAEFRELYAKARAEQRVGLEVRRDGIVMDVTPSSLMKAQRQVAWFQQRIGRLTPKLYRTRL